MENPEAHHSHRGHPQLHTNLRRVIDEIAHIHSKPVLIDSLLATITSIFHSDVSVIYLIDPTEEVFYPNPPIVSTCTDGLPFTPLAAASCCQRILLAPFRWPSDDREPAASQCAFFHSFGQMGFSTWFSLPLRIHDATIGIIGVGYYEHQYLFDDVGQILWEFAQDVSRSLVAFMPARFQTRAQPQPDAGPSARHQQARMRRLLTNHHELTSTLWADDHLPAILQSLSQIVHQPAAILDSFLTPLTTFPQSGHWPSVLTQVKQWVRQNHVGHSTSHPLPVRSERVSGSTFVVAPVQMGTTVLGYLVIWERSSQLDDLDVIAVQQASMVMAVHFFKYGLHVERQGHGFQELINLLLDQPESFGQLQSMEATRLAWHVESSQYVLVAALSEPQRASVLAPTTTFVEDLRIRLSVDYPGIFVARRHEALVFLVPESFGTADGLDPLIQWIRSLVAMQEDAIPALHSSEADNVASVQTSPNIAIGVSAAVSGPASIVDAYSQAHMACALGPIVAPGANYLRAQDVEMYTMLEPLSKTPCARQFISDRLTPLVEYDREHTADLVTTLQVYLAHHGNLSETAAELFIHRTSLQYRLKRIESIIDRKLKFAQVRFELQLAVVLRNLSSLSDTGAD